MKVMRNLRSSLLPSERKEIIRSGPRLGAAACVLTTAILMVLVTGAVLAGSATWNLNPTSADWNTAANWTPATVPNGPADTATFDISNTPSVSFSADTEVNSIVFNASASPFTTTANGVLTISGVGITNDSGITQNFVTLDSSSCSCFPSWVLFSDSVMAGDLTSFTNNGAFSDFDAAGSTLFFNTSTAGNGIFVNGESSGLGSPSGFTSFFNTSANGTFTNDGGSSEEYGGSTNFNDTSTAANGTFTNNGSLVSYAFGGGETVFNGTSTAANGTFSSNGGAVSGAGGGITIFYQDTPTAGNSTLIANGGLNGGLGGSIQFWNGSTGGTARVEFSTMVTWTSACTTLRV